MSEYTDGTLSANVISIVDLQKQMEAIKGVLKNEPIPVNINSEYVSRCVAYRYGNIVSVSVAVIKTQGNTDKVVLASGLPIPETDFIKTLITPSGNFYRYRLDENGVLHEHWTQAFDASNGNIIEFQFTYICK